MPTKRESEPTWLPLSDLPKFSGDITWMLADSSAQLAGLENSIEQPQVRDAALMERLVKYNTEIIGTLGLYREQLDIWLSGDATPVERLELERLQRQLPELKNILDRILSLCAEMSVGDDGKAGVGSDTTKLPISELYKIAGQSEPKRTRA